MSSFNFSLSEGQTETSKCPKSTEAQKFFVQHRLLDKDHLEITLPLQCCIQEHGPTDLGSNIPSDCHWLL